MRTRFATLLLVLTLVDGSTARAGTVPLPPPRPVLPWDAPRLAAVPLPPARPMIELAPRLQGEFVPAPIPAESACMELLADGIVVAESGEIRNASDECSGPPLLRISAVLSSEGKPVELRPAAVLRCEMARELAHWVREDLAKAASMLGSALVRIHVAASYVCRSRNNVSGAPLSEHGRANALDIRAFGLVDGRTLAVVAAETAPEFIAAVRRTACARFTTVLGPGADPAHELHLHVDLAQRRNGYRMCQWREPKVAGP
jgi:hypothetical protein